MSNQNLKCKNCGEEISKKAVVCPKCGAKIKKPFYKKGWFIALVVIFVIAAVSSGSNNSTEKTTTQEPVVQEEIVYTEYSAAQLITDLQDNALNATNKYEGQYVQVTGKLNVIDSDGKYISIDNGGFDLVNIQCFLKTDEQRAKVASLSKKDTVVVKGKVKSVGEVLGYSIDVDSIE